jgi:hypothetical protein
MSNFPEKIKIGVTHSLVSGMLCALYMFSAVVTFGKLDTSFFHGKIKYRNKSKIYRKPLLIHSDFVEVSFFLLRG